MKSSKLSPCLPNGLHQQCLHTHTHTLNKSLQSDKRPALYRQTPVVCGIQCKSMTGILPNRKYPEVRGHAQSKVGTTSNGEQINTHIKTWHGLLWLQTKHVKVCFSCFSISGTVWVWKLFLNYVWVRNPISGLPENGHVGNFFQWTRLLTATGRKEICC